MQIQNCDSHHNMQKVGYTFTHKWETISMLLCKYLDNDRLTTEEEKSASR